VGESTICTTFDFLHVTRVLKITTALVAQKIERTIAEQAVEPLRITMLMAWKISALGISEKFVAVTHATPFYKNSDFQEYPYVFPVNSVYNS